MRLIIILLIFNLSLLAFSSIYRIICEIKFNKRIKEYYDKQK
jgi:hypothetical protein